MLPIALFHNKSVETESQTHINLDLFQNISVMTIYNDKVSTKIFWTNMIQT